MGYSLTNDDSSQPETGKVPDPVTTAGLNFRFGPGSQLNGYKVALGEVGPVNLLLLLMLIKTKV